MSEQNFKHWKVDIDEDSILWLGFDKDAANANTINHDVLDELKQFLEQHKSHTHLKAVVIHSLKKAGFIAGADIDSFKALKTAQDANDLIVKGQKIFSELEAFPVTTIALIKGHCLGGGFELALACDYRIALDDDSTRIGLPEVKLGLQPGWGGSIRLPRLIGGMQAMDLILSGRTVSASAAKKMGIVDATVPERQFRRAAKYYALEKPAAYQPSHLQKITNSNIIRPMLGKIMQSKLKAKIQESHYPAPFAALNNWVKHDPRDDASYVPEADSITNLAVTDTSRNLVRVFFLQSQLKSLAKQSDFKATHVHVIGSGVMGRGIAAECVLKGLRVTIQDQTPNLLGAAVADAHKLFKRKLKKPRKINQAMDRLIPDPQGLGIKQADVIIEAVTEKLDVKRKVFAELEQKAKPDAILATNTSTIPLAEIGEAMQDPSRLVGIHFFNPVNKMPLVEVVHDVKTSKAIKDKALSFVRCIDKLPIPVKSSPGFLVNRILLPYLLESVELLEEGVAAEAIDQAALDFGMPMGPIELSDVVGLDVCLAASQNLVKHLGGKIPTRLVEKVNQGKLGQKSGEGFYQYKKGKKIGSRANAHYGADVADRLILRMVNEAVACLHEGIVDNADMLDAGMIFGAGFPPFRGGPMAYLRTEGEAEIRARLDTLKEHHGERFTAEEGWGQIAAA